MHTEIKSKKSEFPMGQLIRKIILIWITSLFISSLLSCEREQLWLKDDVPEIASVTSSTPDGRYRAGSSIDITITFTEEVILTGGTLEITLDSGATISIAPFGPSLTTYGTYTISPGENSTDLNIVSIALSSGAALTDISGNSANITIPAITISSESNIVIDTAFPVISAAETLDTDKNGRIDHYKLTFSENVQDSTFPGYIADSIGNVQTEWLVAGYSNVRLAHGSALPSGITDTPNDNIIYIVFDESLDYDTGVKPDLTTTAAPQLTDIVGNTLAQVQTLDIAESDSANPIIFYARGAAGTNILSIIFSEPVDSDGSSGGCDAPLQSGDFTYTNSGGSASSIISMTLDADACDENTVGLVLDSSISAGDSTDTISPASGSIFDISDNPALILPLALTVDPNDTVFVKTTGNDSNSGFSPADAKQTIGSAIALASGTTSVTHIKVSEGNYDPASTLTIDFDIIIEGGYDLSFQKRDAAVYITSISPAGSIGNTIEFTGTSVTNAAVIDGFTINGSNNNGAAAQGNGIYINAGAEPTIQNNIITGGNNNTNINSGNGILSYTSSGLILSNTLLGGNNNDTGGSNNGISILNESAVHTIKGNSITAGTSAAVTVAGIRIESSNPNINNNPLIKGSNDPASTDGNAIYIVDTSSAGTVIDANYIEGGAGNKVRCIYTASNASITNNTFAGGAATGTTASSSIIDFAGGPATANSFDNNNITMGNAPAGDGTVYGISIMNTTVNITNNTIVPGTFAVIPNGYVDIYIGNDNASAVTPLIQGNNITGGTAENTFGIYMDKTSTSASMDPQIDGNTIITGNATSGTSCGVILEGTPGSAEARLNTFTNNSIQAGDAGAYSVGISLRAHEDGQVKIGGNNIIRSGNSQWASYGIYTNSGTGSVISGNIEISSGDSASGSTYGIFSSDTPVDIRDNKLIKAGNNTDGSSHTYGIYMATNNALLSYIERNTISAGDRGDKCYGIWMGYGNDIIVKNNYINGAGEFAASDSIGIYVDAGGLGTAASRRRYAIYNNTINGGRSASSNAVAIWMSGQVYTYIVNNILLTESTAGIGIKNGDQNSYPPELRNNLFVYCPSAMYWDGPSSQYSNTDSSTTDTLDDNDNSFETDLSANGTTALNNRAFDTEPAVTDLFILSTVYDYHLTGTITLPIDNGIDPISINRTNPPNNIPVNVDYDNVNRTDGNWDIGYDEF